MSPSNLKYLQSHEWVKIEGDSATVGITDYAVSHLSDLVFLDLPAVGKKVAQGQSFGSIESVKAVVDIYSPVTGEVTAINEDLVEHLDRLGADPYGAGWMIKVKVGKDSGADKLLDGKAYAEHLKTQPQ
jgi:glycine cleavage system H protein